MRRRLRLWLWRRQVSVHVLGDGRLVMVDPHGIVWVRLWGPEGG